MDLSEVTKINSVSSAEKEEHARNLQDGFGTFVSHPKHKTQFLLKMLMANTYGGFTAPFTIQKIQCILFHLTLTATLGTNCHYYHHCSHPAD
jgi:hypothetical protein